MDSEGQCVIDRAAHEVCLQPHERPVRVCKKMGISFFRRPSQPIVKSLSLWNLRVALEEPGWGSWNFLDMPKLKGTATHIFQNSSSTQVSLSYYHRTVSYRCNFGVQSEEKIQYAPQTKTFTMLLLYYYRTPTLSVTVSKFLPLPYPPILPYLSAGTRTARWP